MMIPDDKKEEVRQAADLVEVVGDYVRLKRSGSGFMGLCPFHDEKTPSFHVTPSMGIYKCFGCGAGGDLFSFVMEMEGVGFSEALRTLADRYGVNLPQQTDPEERRLHREKEGIYHALRFAGLYFHRCLVESEEASDARSYLEKRGYDRKVIRAFGLGYAPASGQALLKEAEREGIDTETLMRADLIKPRRKGEGYYDTFRDRLMIPVFNPSGKVIAFAGRVLGEKKEAKYINSSQTDVYNKSEVVYGVHLAKNEIRRQEEVILVEGYTDVITLHQAEIRNVAASSGTALTPGQVRVLGRYGNRVVMIYDSDSAGLNAMKRGMNVALAEGMEVQLLELPDREDPDSFVRKYGKSSFVELKEKKAADFVTFSIRLAEREGRTESPAGITRLIGELLESIAGIPEALSRQVHVQHLHQKTQKYRSGSDRELFEQLDAILRRKRSERPPARRQVPEGPPPPGSHEPVPPIPAPEAASGPDVPQQRKRPHYEMELIRLMLTYGHEMVDYVGRLCNENLFEDEQLRSFYLDLIDRHRSGEEIGAEHYVHREAPFPALTGEVMLERYSASERHFEKTGNRFLRDRDPYLTAKSTIKPLRLHFLKREIATLAGRIKHAGPEEKIRLIKKQKRTQSEISLMERTAAAELFPDREGRQKKSAKSEVFEYTMKQKESGEGGE